MQPNKTKLSLAIGAACLVASSALMADTFSATINTISDVTIGTEQALNFGEAITTTASTTCQMVGQGPLLADVGIKHGTPGPAAGYAVLTGSGCVGSGVTTGTPGIYSVSGTPGLTVELTISEVAQGGDYTFKPDSGCYSAYNGDATADADLCTNYTMGTPVSNVLLPVDTATEIDGSTAGFVTPGVIYFTVGGTIAVGPSGLISNQTYDADFQVDVTY